MLFRRFRIGIGTVFSRADCIAACVLVSLALSIFLESYLHSIRLTPDGAVYLRTARSLMAGHGLRINSGAGDSAFYLTAWPVGYPALIAAMAGLTGLNVLLASKFVAFFLSVAMLLVFRRRYPSIFWMVALLMLSQGYLKIFKQSWSEQSFIAGMVWLALSLRDVLAKDRPSGWAYAGVGLSGLALFFCRYIGIFAVGLIGLAALYAFWRKKGHAFFSSDRIRKPALLLVTAFIVFGTAGLYLLNNRVQSGGLTGPRLLAPETNLALATNLAGALLKELAGSAAALLLGAWVWWKCRRAGTRSTQPAPAGLQDWAVFMVVGTAYAAAVVLMRWVVHFDPFNYRLLFPATFMWLIALFLRLTREHSDGLASQPGILLPGKVVILICTLIFADALESSTVVENAVRVGLGKEPKVKQGYRELAARLNAKYEPIPPHSLVMFGDEAMNFLRPDLVIDSPGMRPYVDPPETLSGFLGRHPVPWSVYFMPSGVPAEKREFMDPSTRALVDASRTTDGPFVRLSGPSFDPGGIRRP